MKHCAHSIKGSQVLLLKVQTQIIIRTWLLLSGCCQLWNQLWHCFSFDWAILSSEPLCSVQLNFLQLLMVSSTPDASLRVSCQKVEPLCNRRVISYPNTCSPGIGKGFLSVELQAQPSSCPRPQWGEYVHVYQAKPQHAKLSFLPEVTCDMPGCRNMFHNLVVEFEEPSCKKSPTKKWNRENNSQNEVPLDKGEIEIKESLIQFMPPQTISM